MLKSNVYLNIKSLPDNFNYCLHFSWKTFSIKSWIYRQATLYGFIKNKKKKKSQRTICKWYFRSLSYHDDDDGNLFNNKGKVGYFNIITRYTHSFCIPSNITKCWNVCVCHDEKIENEEKKKGEKKIIIFCPLIYFGCHWYWSLFKFSLFFRSY